jgi:hypothetical protein
MKGGPMDESHPQLSQKLAGFKKKNNELAFSINFFLSIIALYVLAYDQQ